MLKITLKIKCPKHPKYNPDKGPEGIKGGCTICQEIFMCYMEVKAIDRRVHRIIEEHTKR